MLSGVQAAQQGFRPPSPEFDPLEARSEPGFDHVVVLMYENRSFDNILGFLYENDELNGRTFDGLNQGSYSNVGPAGETIPAHVYEGETDKVMRHPQPDPGEHYPHVNTQIFGIVDPATNAELLSHELEPPYNAPVKDSVPAMSGFVRDYVINYRELKKGTEPTFDEYKVAMGSFSPLMLPVFSAIAKNFAVYDAWFCAVPSPDLLQPLVLPRLDLARFRDEQGPRRLRQVDRRPRDPDDLQPARGGWAHLARLLRRCSSWSPSPACCTPPCCSRTGSRTSAAWSSSTTTRRTATCPAYAFIEPRMIFNHNDMHPPFGTLREGEYEGEKVYNSALSDVRAGEALLHDVYTAMRNARSDDGVERAEHRVPGHVRRARRHLRPRAAAGGVPPTQDAAPGEMGFTFDRLGCRVPAILVSAYTQAGTIVHDEMHHGALVATLNRLHGLEPLSRRDATANNVVQRRSTCRSRGSRSPGRPRILSSSRRTRGGAAAAGGAQAPAALDARRRACSGCCWPATSRTRPIPDTYGEAYDILVKHGDGPLRGPRLTPQKRSPVLSRTMEQTLAHCQA